MNEVTRILPIVALLLSACVLFHDTEVRLPPDLESDTGQDAPSSDLPDSIPDLGDVSDLELGSLCGADDHCFSENCSNNHCAPEGYAYVPAGTFGMGSPDGVTQDPGSAGTRPAEPGRASEELLHEVTLNRSFFMLTHEVTQGEWRDQFETNPSADDSCGEDCPLESVTWYEALVYMNALSSAEDLEQCYSLTGCEGQPGEGMTCAEVTFYGLDCPGYRLPTEAEWEYAARAGTLTAYYNGDSDEEHLACQTPFLLTDIAWYCGNAEGSLHCIEETTPNDWGLYDLSGNVMEWVWDRYQATYYATSSLEDPLGPDAGESRVARGGGWVSLAHQCRSASRFGGDPSSSLDYLGFRPVRTVP